MNHDRPDPIHSWEVTGNHAVAIPCISPLTGGIHRVGVLHRGLLGSIDWAAALEPEPDGAALLTPQVLEGDRLLALGSLEWERTERWIPSFRATVDGLRIRATVCAPAAPASSLRGAVVLLDIENAAPAERTVQLAMAGRWVWTLLTILSPRPLRGMNRLVSGRHVAGIVLEGGADSAGAALAVIGAGDDVRVLAAGDGTELRRLTPGQTLEAENGQPLSFAVQRPLTVPGRGRAAAAFFLGLAPERDGALQAAAALRAVGAEELIRGARLELSRLMRRVDEPRLATILNRNLLFNYFFAAGRALDDDHYYPVASRSSIASSGPVFNERESLLWSLPAITLADPAGARELLLRSFEQFSHRPGERFHYIDGGTLAPGFALDHLCAYPLALDRFVRDIGDDTLLDEPIVQDVLRETEAALLARLHPEIFLCSTELLPSGEPATHPYVTYDNVLVWAACQALGRTWVARDADDRSRIADAADEVAAAVWRHCTAEVHGLRILAWSTDLNGEAAVYDDPAGSLQLLPFLGFCDLDDPIWNNTMELLHSEDYPFWLGSRPFPGTASRDRPDQAHIGALCSDLLGYRRLEALHLLERLPLDAGLAAERFDPDTGAARTGRHSAAAAGFLAWSLWHALES